jgi:signal transduction histidine kinase
MFRSLRARLLAWYTAVLVVVVTTFGALVCVATWRTRIAGIDTLLRVQALQMASALRPAGDGRFDLVLPAPPAAGNEPMTYYVVWDAAGRIIERSDPDLDLTAPSGTETRTVGGRREVALETDAGPVIVVGRDLSDVRQDVRSLAMSMALVGAAALGVSLAGVWLLVGRSLKQERRFTADASHELRTPLATLLTETQTILARDRDAAAYRESLEVCRRAADRMRVIVERLLLLARADAGEVPMAEAPVRLDLLSERVAGDVKAIAAERNVGIALACEPATVRGDADRLMDAITNLVTNAIDYNVPNGRVDIRVGARNGHVELRIADTGIGIDAADVPHIFDRFYRADPARARVRGGAGLGLAVARWVVEQHGGRITCDSEPGKGSVFTVVLAAAPDAAPGAR